MVGSRQPTRLASAADKTRVGGCLGREVAPGESARIGQEIAQAQVVVRMIASVLSVFDVAV